MSEIILLTLAASILFFISYKDITQGIVPDISVIAVALLALPRILKDGDFYPILSALILGITLLALRLIFQKLKNTPGIGLGDIKLIAAIGLWIPPHMIPQLLITCGILGIITHFLWAKQKRFNTSLSIQWGTTFPFAPSLSISCLVTIFLSYTK